MTKNQYVLSGTLNTAMGIYLLGTCDCYSAIIVGGILIFCGVVGFVTSFFVKGN